jgi:dephospho-CoA kinase
VHPRVKDDFLLWCNTVKSPVVAMESAILFESGFSGAVDFIVCVYADKEVCIARACKRSSLSREEVVRRIDKQSSTETIIEQSDFSICNNPDTPLLPQFEKMMGIIGDKIL